MTQEPVFKLLAEYILPTYIEIPPAPAGKSGCEHMGVGHELACELAFCEKAYAAVLTPDCMLADGGIARLQELAQTGIEIVVAAALRFGEEPLFAHLRDMGVLSQEANGTVLTITPRQMVKAAINSFHSHSASCEWESSYFPHVPHCAWWRVPQEDGVLLHSLSWAPLLIDYNIFRNHNVTAMRDWTIDGDYLHKNIDDETRLHVVQDSDELFLASWTPLSEREIPKYPILNWKLIGGPIWCVQFKTHFDSPLFDPLKRKLFLKAVRWHSRTLNANWNAVEQIAMRKIQDVAYGPTKLRWNVIYKLVFFLRRLYNWLRRVANGEILTMIREYLARWRAVRIAQR